MSEILINTTAGQLKAGQRVKLRHMKQFWRCVIPATEKSGYFTRIERNGRSQFLSRGWKVQVPLEDDAVLGGAVKP